jgi:hypothetical protein
MLLRLIFITLALSACSRLQNEINFVRLVCGSELSSQDPEFALYRIKDSLGAFVDLSTVPYEIFNEEFVSSPRDQYRFTSSGCLQMKKQGKAFLRLPLKGEASATLRDQNLLNELQLILDKTAPTITLPVTRSNFRKGETITVAVNEASRTRYCVDAPGQELCALKDGPRLAFESESFQDFQGTIPLPQVEGSYRLSIVAEDRNGLPGLLLQNFTIDSTIPVVEVDFAQVAETFLFDGKAHFYLDQGYRLGFRSKSEPLNQLTIEYCLVPADQGDSCSPESIRIFGIENPEALPAGAWTLIYRATDLSGNRAEGWDRLRILAKSICTEQELLNALAQPEPITCTELVGDLSVNRVDPAHYDRLKTLVGVSGKISLMESDRTTVPQFPNLRRLTRLEIRDNYELLELDMMPALTSVEDINISDNDALVKFSGFHQLRTLRNLTVSSGEMEDFDVFSSLMSVEGQLSLNYLDGLKSLDFLKSIQSIDAISLDHLDGLSSLSPLKSCHIKSSVFLNYLSSVKELKGLENSKTLDKLFISKLAIESLDGLENLERVTAEFALFGNSELTSMDGLRSLRIVGDLKIDENNALVDLIWTSPLEEVDFISIKSNEGLRSIKGFDLVTGGTPLIRIVSNPSLTKISGWTKIPEIAGLTIQDNESLESIDFGAGLTKLKQSIAIQENPKLKLIKGFGSLNQQANLDIVVKADLDPSQNALSSYTNAQDM